MLRLKLVFALSLLAAPALADVVARAEQAGAPLPAALSLAPDPDLALLTLLRLVEAAEDDDEDWDEPEASYTWLHYIVLVVVAFVLGLLVWQLLLKGPDANDFQTDQAAPAAVHSLILEHPGAAA